VIRRLAVAWALALVACEHAPTREVAAGEQMVARAQAAGAETYAPDRWKQAEAANRLAHQRLQERDYQGALSAANDAAECARLAIETVGPAKEKARGDAELGLGEVRAILERAATERAAAARAGVPRRTLEALDARVAQAGLRVAAAAQQIEAGNYAVAADSIAALRTEVAPLPDLYRAARASHDTRQPRARARGRRAARPSR
jgi:hypothetical protein